MKYSAYIGLGSNLSSSAGRPEQTVQAAVLELSKLGEVTAQSSLYRTAPVGFREQPDFTNAAIRLQTDFEPEDLLQAMLAVERAFGRDRATGIPKGPRTLDLDLLMVFPAANEHEDGAVLRDSPVLSLPHPEIANRLFVLQPLAEIAPGLRHPVLQKTMQELLVELS
jgi:2-amino-4-hydroxy-6-hydroxymethyldihydropteridine diphosphokinase